LDRLPKSLLSQYSMSDTTLRTLPEKNTMSMWRWEETEQLLAHPEHGMFNQFHRIDTDWIHWIGQRPDLLHGQTYHVSYDSRPHPDIACLCNFITTIQPGLTVRGKN